MTQFDDDAGYTPPRFDDDETPDRKLEVRAVERAGRTLAWVTLLALAAIEATHRVASWDFWWHLAIGREAITTRSTVPFDTFSYTFEGQPYVHKDLIADILMYVAFDRLSYLGIGLLLAFATVAASLGLRLAIGRHRPLVWMVLTIVLVGAIQGRLIPRPLLFTEGLFPVMLGVLEYARRQLGVVSERTGRPSLSARRRFGRALLAAIALEWVWLNLHRGGLIGLVLLVGFAGWTALAALPVAAGPVRRLLGPRATPMQAAAAFGAAGAAICVGVLNPNGLALYRSGLSVTHDPIHQTMITEWAGLTLETARTVHPVGVSLVAAAWLALVARLVVSLVRAPRDGRPSVDVWHAGVLAVMTWQGIESMRYMSYASATAAAILGLVWVELADSREHARGELSLPRGAAILAALAGVLGVAHLNPHEAGLGMQSNRFPVAALQQARALDLGPRVFNSFTYGGFTIFEGNGRWRVAIDGRNDMLYPSEFYRDCVVAAREPAAFAEFWAAHPADWVLADNTPTVDCVEGNCRDRANFTFLAHDPAWMPVYWSEEAVIYVPRAGNDALASRAFRLVDPGDLIGSVQRALRAAGDDADALRAVRLELSRLVEASPDSVRANVLLTMYFAHLGPDGADEVRALLTRLNEIAPDHEAVLQLNSMFGFDPSSGR